MTANYKTLKSVMTSTGKRTGQILSDVDSVEFSDEEAEAEQSTECLKPMPEEAIEPSIPSLLSPSSKFSPLVVFAVISAIALLVIFSIVVGLVLRAPHKPARRTATSNTGQKVSRQRNRRGADHNIDLPAY